MAHDCNPHTSKMQDVDQPAFSRLSVEAPCFIPANFEQSISSIADEAPSYFNDFVWQETELKDASAYLSDFGQWPLGHAYGNPGVQSSFHYGQYRPPIDYWPVTLGNENLSSRISPSLGQPPDRFNSPYADVSWNGSPLQEPSVSAGLSMHQPKSKRAKDPGRTHPGPTNSAAAAALKENGHSAYAFTPPDCGEPVKAKKKKKKSRNSIVRLESSGGAANAEASTDAQSRDAKGGKIVEEEVNNARGSNTGLIADDSTSSQTGSKVYKDNVAQTDFSEELSQLTLSERPNSLYDQSVLPDYFKGYSFTENLATTALNSAGTVPPSKPLLWASIVSQTAVHPPRKTAASDNNVPFDLGFKSISNQLTRPGINSVNKKNERKLGFDHSSIRSQSGKRKSTGISTNDQQQDQSSSGKAKREYSSGKHDYSVGKQKESSAKPVSATSGKNVNRETSSLNKARREGFVDGKRIQSAVEGGSQRVLKSTNNDFQPGNVVRGQKQLRRENRDNQIPPADRYEERILRSGESRSPSWRRSQTIGSSSRPKTAELSRSASGGQRVTSAGLTSSAKNKEKDKWQETKSGKIHILQGNDSKHGQTMLTVKPGIKTEGTAKRRRKKGKKKTGAKEDSEIVEKAPAAENNASLSVGPNILMQFDDDDEFPGLLHAAQLSLNEISSGPIKYSDILSGRAKTPVRNYVSSRSKTATKENKADASVEDEVSDWDLDISASEQRESPHKAPPKIISARSVSQPPKSTSKQAQEKRAVGAGAKTKEPITLSLFDMITVKSKNKKTPEKDEEKKPLKTGVKTKKESKSGNVLDSSGVQMRRGKEREVPKAKKPSLLRKVILKERESRRQKFLRDCMRNSGEEEETDAATDLTEEDICDEGPRRHASAPMRTSEPRIASVSPSATREVASPQDDQPASEAEDSRKQMLQSMIHSRRFREYCTQVLSKEIDDCCLSLLQELVRFQDRLYHKDPNKARLKRRIVLGLREVTKHLKARRIKSVIISPNLERIQSKGGLDEALHNIIEMCQGQNIPFIFALSRRQLGKACCKVVPVSVVGIFSYEGAEEHFKKLKDLTEKARESYEEMVSNLAAELEDLCKLYPVGSWPVDENICHEKSSEDTSTPSSPCEVSTNANIIVDKTDSLSSCCMTLGDAAEAQGSPVDMANSTQQSKEDMEISHKSPPDSAQMDC